MMQFSGAKLYRCRHSSNCCT